MGIIANSLDHNEMQLSAAFHHGLLYLQRIKQLSGSEIHQDLEHFTCGPLMYTMGFLLLFVSFCMRNEFRIQRKSMINTSKTTVKYKHKKRVCMTWKCHNHRSNNDNIKNTVNMS